MYQGCIQVTRKCRVSCILIHTRWAIKIHDTYTKSVDFSFQWNKTRQTRINNLTALYVGISDTLLYSPQRTLPQPQKKMDQQLVITLRGCSSHLFIEYARIERWYIAQYTLHAVDTVRE